MMSVLAIFFLTVPGAGRGDQLLGTGREISLRVSVEKYCFETQNTGEER